MLHQHDTKRVSLMTKGQGSFGLFLLLIYSRLITVPKKAVFLKQSHCGGNGLNRFSRHAFSLLLISLSTPTASSN